jgi:hypothetical protein
LSALAAEPRAGARARRLTLIAMSLGFAVVQLGVSVLNVAVRAIGAVWVAASTRCSGC